MLHLRGCKKIVKEWFFYAQISRPNGARWVLLRKKFFIPVKVLSRKFRGKFSRTMRKLSSRRLFKMAPLNFTGRLVVHLISQKQSPRSARRSRRKAKVRSRHLRVLRDLRGKKGTYLAHYSFFYSEKYIDIIYFPRVWVIHSFMGRGKLCLSWDISQIIIQNELGRLCLKSLNLNPASNFQNSINSKLAGFKKLTRSGQFFCGKTEKLYFTCRIEVKHIPAHNLPRQTGIRFT